MLGLSHVRFSPIGDESTRGISGGQRKRVNVGIELAGDPSVLLLDEPTSGLDASASKAICESLRKLADIGLTIIAVIHQPRYEIFTLYVNKFMCVLIVRFDKVLLLGKGRTVYFGPTSDVEQYFENVGFQCPPK
jgi:ABC-type multidrug transport system ATPase subunit